MTPETKSTINFGPIKGGLEFSGFTISGRKLHLKIDAPHMVHHGALRLRLGSPRGVRVKVRVEDRGRP